MAKRTVKKPFTMRNPEVLCDNPHCAEINNIEGVVRQPIKQNVIDGAPEGTAKFLCYYCSLAANQNDGSPIRTKKDVKKMRAASKTKRAAREPQVMTAEETT